jgi:dCTP deaminase
MSILSDTQIADLINPVTFDEFHRGMATALNASVYRNADPRSMIHHDVYFIPRLDITRQIPIVRGCWSSDFSDIPFSDELLRDHTQLANLLYPIYVERFKPMIAPFHPELIRQVPKDLTAIRKVISYGISSFGYDATLADELKLFTNINATVIDPKRFDERALVDAKIHEDSSGDRYVLLPPNSYLLGRTIEHFNLPRDITAIFLAKSTYARSGVLINTTPGEAGWCGHLVVEIGNLTNLPVRIYVGEGILQALFFKGDKPCTTSYKDRGGKYMNQVGVTLAKV